MTSSSVAGRHLVLVLESEHDQSTLKWMMKAQVSRLLARPTPRLHTQCLQLCLHTVAHAKTKCAGECHSMHLIARASQLPVSDQPERLT